MVPEWLHDVIGMPPAQSLSEYGNSMSILGANTPLILKSCVASNKYDNILSSALLAPLVGLLINWLILAAG